MRTITVQELRQNGFHQTHSIPKGVWDDLGVNEQSELIDKYLAPEVAKESCEGETAIAESATHIIFLVR